MLPHTGELRTNGSWKPFKYMLPHTGEQRTQQRFWESISLEIMEHFNNC